MNSGGMDSSGHLGSLKTQTVETLHLSSIHDIALS
jgi:hypothetical protein